MQTSDPGWFALHAKRQARIRDPFPDEFSHTWHHLGGHDAGRRRVLVWRVPGDNPGRHLVPDGLMRVPFLAFSDETIENSDAVLLPILDSIMKDAAAQEADHGFVRTGAGVVVN